MKIFYLKIVPVDDSIVRNSFLHGCWGQEEVAGQYNIKTLETFEMSITVNSSHYSLSLNGEHFADYYHRMSPSLVQFYRVYGKDLEIEEIRLESGSTTSFVTPKEIMIDHVPHIPILLQNVTETTRVTTQSTEVNRLIPRNENEMFSTSTASSDECSRLCLDVLCEASCSICLSVIFSSL